MFSASLLTTIRYKQIHGRAHMNQVARTAELNLLIFSAARDGKRNIASLLGLAKGERERGRVADQQGRRYNSSDSCDQIFTLSRCRFLPLPPLYSRASLRRLISGAHHCVCVSEHFLGSRVSLSRSLSRSRLRERVCEFLVVALATKLDYNLHSTRLETSTRCNLCRSAIRFAPPTAAKRLAASTAYSAHEAPPPPRAPKMNGRRPVCSAAGATRPKCARPSFHGRGNGHQEQEGAAPTT